MVNQQGWIYICMDIKVTNECKVGMTRRSLYKRITETGNPDYMIVKAYKVPQNEMPAIKKLEKYLQRELGKVYTRKRHFITGKKSEWFRCSPVEATKIIEDNLARCLGLQDEDGNTVLGEIDIFKPFHCPENELQYAERVYDVQHYYNIINAIKEA